MSAPVFAVVGPPNKGKSSIVATLARDDSVAIGPQPGTTMRARHYPMKVDGRTLYTLVDTPGFQRARRALAWLRARETTAAERAAAVRAFVEAPGHAESFPDECELLKPVVDGAAILYVVDGSVPFGEEYAAEMEILRATGRPRMALVNPIGRADHIDDWRNGLRQYFDVVRVFDPMTAPFDKQVELLRAFGALDEDWTAPLGEAVDVLLADRRNRRRAAARAIGGLIAEVAALKVERRIEPDEDPEPYRPRLVERYRERLSELERNARRAVEAAYDYHAVDRIEDAFPVLDEDLFSEDNRFLFGLTRAQLLKRGLVGGAASGAGIGAWVDAHAGGATLLGGALVGGAIGAAGGAWGAVKGAEAIADFKLSAVGGSTGVVGKIAEGLSRGNVRSRRLQYGPSRHPNVPFLLLGRARLHHRAVAGRTHAARDALRLEAGESQPPFALEEVDRRAIARACAAVRDGREAGDARRELIDRVEEILARDDRGEDRGGPRASI